MTYVAIVVINHKIGWKIFFTPRRKSINGYEVFFLNVLSSNILYIVIEAVGVMQFKSPNK